MEKGPTTITLEKDLGRSADNGSEITLTSPETATPQPQTDGGLVAWSQVVAAHLVSFNAWGYIASYGLFQAYYTQTLGKSPSDISWVGTLQVFLTFGLGTFSGHAYDVGYYRPIVAAGLALQVLGAFMTSLSTSYWQLVLAQGICQGIGNGLAFCPSVNLVSSYFVRRRALALAIMSSGLSTGGIVFPLIARQLLGTLGFGWTIRIMGFVLLANSAIILVLARPRPPKGLQGKIVDFAAFKDLSFNLFGAGMLLAVLATYFAYYYVVPFAQDIIQVSNATSLDLLIVINAVGLPGRIIPAQLADRWLGPINTLILVIVASGLLTFCWAAVTSLAGIWGFAVVYGFFGASVQSMFPPALASLTSDKSTIHDRVCLMFSILSIGSLCGAPIAGALVQSDGGRYLSAQTLMGAIMLVAATILIGAKCVRFTRNGLWSRV